MYPCVQIHLDNDFTSRHWSHDSWIGVTNGYLGNSPKIAVVVQFDELTVPINPYKSMNRNEFLIDEIV